MNPFLSGFGFFQIIFTDKQYVVVQNYPQKVVFSKQFSPESKKTGKEIFEEYMKKEGFEFGEQLGTEFTFYKENKKEVKNLLNLFLCNILFSHHIIFYSRYY